MGRAQDRLRARQFPKHVDLRVEALHFVVQKRITFALSNAGGPTKNQLWDLLGPGIGRRICHL